MFASFSHVRLCKQIFIPLMLLCLLYIPCWWNSAAGDPTGVNSKCPWEYRHNTIRSYHQRSKHSNNLDRYAAGHPIKYAQSLVVFYGMMDILWVRSRCMCLFSHILQDCFTGIGEIVYLSAPLPIKYSRRIWVNRMVNRMVSNDTKRQLCAYFIGSLLLN